VRSKKIAFVNGALRMRFFASLFKMFTNRGELNRECRDDGSTGYP
jgi:hypothetical protein